MAADLFFKLFNQDWQIKGSSTDEVFPGAIALKSFSLDAEGTVTVDAPDTKPMDSSASPQAKATAEQEETEEPLDAFSFEIKKDFDISSTVLFRNYAMASTKTATIFSKAEVYCRIGGPTLQPGMKPEQLCFLVYEFRNIFVYEYSLEVSDKSSVPVEKCKFYFDKYRITYRPQAQSGKLGTPLALGWDFEADKSF